MSESIVNLSNSAIERILEIQSKAQNKNKHLRVTVSGGGCSGFQYEFSLDDKFEDSDFKIKENENLLLTIDDVSIDFLKDCTIDFVSDLGGSHFKINNPNAKATCGCGSSFAI